MAVTKIVPWYPWGWSIYCHSFSTIASENSFYYFNDVFILHEGVLCLLVCKCTTYVHVSCAHSASGGEKRVLDALRLELQKVIRYHVVPVTGHRSSTRTANLLNC